MKKVIKSQKLQPIDFTCDECGTTYQSDEYKVGSQPMTIGREIKTVKTYTDKCPECKTKNIIRDE